MSVLEGSTILRAGLTVQRQRFETIVTNMANAHATRTPEGGPYRRRSLVIESVPSGESFGSIFGQEINRPLTTVRAAGVLLDNSPPVRRYDPAHPDADAEGYVSLPNVDPAAEMVDLMATTRSFQAMVAGLGAIRELVSRSLEIGK